MVHCKTFYLFIDNKLGPVVHLVYLKTFHIFLDKLVSVVSFSMVSCMPLHLNDNDLYSRCLCIGLS